MFLNASLQVDPEYRSIVVIDMAGSGRWDDRAQLRARTTFDQIARNSVRRAGIVWQRLVVEERGDGMILLLRQPYPKWTYSIR